MPQLFLPLETTSGLSEHTTQGFIYEFGGYKMPFIIASGIALVDGIFRILLVSDDTSSWKDTEDHKSSNHAHTGKTSSSHYGIECNPFIFHSLSCGLLLYQEDSEPLHVESWRNR